MITISKDANRNYLAKIVKLKGLKKHSNADRLQCVIIDFQNVITDMTAKDGDVYVFFPVECEINKDFLSFVNAFREKELNQDQTQVGFFEKNCRVRAVKLRGEKSEGFILPVHKLEEFSRTSITDVDVEFDSVNGVVICKKYVVKTQQPKKDKTEQKRKKQVSRIVHGQVNLHVDTANYRKNVHRIMPFDNVSVSYKLHGTSFWVSNVLVKRKLKWYEKVLKKIGVKIDELEHDYVYGSRKVVKNRYMDDSRNGTDFYKSTGKSVWAEIADDMKDKLPEGFTVYGEAVGFTSNNIPIQKGFDYGCKQGEKKVFVYRVTFTNSKGYVYNLSTNAVIDFCKRYDLEHVPYFFVGRFNDLVDLLSDGVTVDQDNIVNCLEEYFQFDKDCHMCNNKVPREGIVIRKESQFDFEPYKLKSFRFLEWETKQFDKGEVDMESEN